MRSSSSRSRRSFFFLLLYTVCELFQRVIKLPELALLPFQLRKLACNFYALHIQPGEPFHLALAFFQALIQDPGFFLVHLLSFDRLPKLPGIILQIRKPLLQLLLLPVLFPVFCIQHCQNLFQIAKRLQLLCLLFQFPAKFRLFLRLLFFLLLCISFFLLLLSNQRLQIPKLLINPSLLLCLLYLKPECFT